MLKKLLYIGLGISIIAVKKSASFICSKTRQAAGRDVPFPAPGSNGVSQPQTTGRADIREQTASHLEANREEQLLSTRPIKRTLAADDLTVIKGIGPTYARRLHAAGISSYQALSGQSPEELRSISKATGQSADVESWITQAAALV